MNHPNPDHQQEKTESELFCPSSQLKEAVALEAIARAEKAEGQLAWMGELLKHCPTASFHYNDDPDIEFADGSSKPVGFTIRIADVEDEAQFVASTLEKCIDLARGSPRLPIQQANPN